MSGAVPLGQARSRSLASRGVKFISSLYCAVSITAPAFAFCCRYLAHCLCSGMLLSNSVVLLLGNFAKKVFPKTCPMLTIMKFCFCFICQIGKSSWFHLNGSALIVWFLVDITIIACIISLISFSDSIFLMSFAIYKFGISNCFQWWFLFSGRSSTSPLLCCDLDIS